MTFLFHIESYARIMRTVSRRHLRFLICCPSASASRFICGHMHLPTLGFAASLLSEHSALPTPCSCSQAPAHNSHQPSASPFLRRLQRPHTLVEPVTNDWQQQPITCTNLKSKCEEWVSTRVPSIKTERQQVNMVEGKKDLSRIRAK